MVKLTDFFNGFASLGTGYPLYMQYETEHSDGKFQLKCVLGLTILWEVYMNCDCMAL